MPYRLTGLLILVLVLVQAPAAAPGQEGVLPQTDEHAPPIPVPVPSRVEPQQPPQHDPPAGRWQVHVAQIAVAGEGVGEHRSATNTILVDSATGQTFILWPSDDLTQPYAWIPVPFRAPQAD